MIIANDVVFPVVAAAVITATVTDLRTRRIPNWLVGPLLLAGLMSSCLFGGWIGFENSVFGMLEGGLILGAFWFVGGMGMGDVKLCAALGAWLGPQQLGVALITMGICGGVLALGWAISGGFVKETLMATGEIITGIGSRGFQEHPTINLNNPTKRRMPYAPAIAAGALLSFLSK